VATSRLQVFKGHNYHTVNNCSCMATIIFLFSVIQIIVTSLTYLLHRCRRAPIFDTALTGSVLVFLGKKVPSSQESHLPEVL